MRHLLSLLLVAAAASSAAAAGPTLGPDFTPHPLETRVQLKNGDVSMTERFRGCGTSFTTEAPAYTFTLTEPMTDLRVWIDAPSVLVMPVDGSPYVCVKGGVAYFSDWPAGTYGVYLFGNSIGVGANIRIEMPQRAQAEATAAVVAAPEIVLDPGLPDNPRYLTLVAGGSFRPELAGLACGAPRVTPLARLVVATGGSWTVTAAGRRATYVATADGSCLARNDNTGAMHLKPGTYALWGQLGSSVPDDTAWELEIAADDQPLRFTGAPTYELGELAAPLALPSTLQKIRWGPTRRAVCRDLPRTPAFFVHAATDLGQVSLEPLRQAGRAPQMVVYGPLEDVKPYQVWRCDETARALIEARAGKTWAVFLTQEGGAPGAPIVSVARRFDRRPDPMAAPLPVPAEVPLAERVLARHYPFYGDGSVERFFLEAPEELFVYLGAADGDVPADEPLALVSVNEGRAAVARFDGSGHEVALAGLSTVRPAAVALPKQHPPVTTAKDLDEALLLAGPADKPIVDAYQAAEDKYRGCVGSYMAKHDPSWGKNYELIYVNSGRNVSDVWFRRADSACGYAGLDARGRKLTAAVNKARKKSAAAYLKALRARFTTAR